MPIRQTARGITERLFRLPRQGETYWKVENGIRLTGMPAYVGSVPEDAIWKMSLMLTNADKLPAAAAAICGNRCRLSRS